MPSEVVTAHTTAKVVAPETRNARYKVTSLTIDNTLGAADHEITIQDAFTPDVSHGAGTTTAKTIDRLTVPVVIGDSVTLAESDLKGVRCIGALTVVAEATTGIDTGCYISVGYDID